MLRQAGREVRRGLWAGLLTGLAGAAVMVSATLALRTWLGIPLPVELASDRIVPTLSIGEFNRLARRMGGLVRGKEVAFQAGLAAQFLLAVAGGLLFVLVSAWLGRPADRRGTMGRRSTRAVMGMAVVLMGVFALEMAVLWPVLASNYRGLPPGPARWASAAGLLVPLVLYGLVLFWVHRLLFQPALPVVGHPGGSPEEREAAAGASRPLTRRAVLAGAGTVTVGLVGAWLGRGLTRRATFGTFGYDGLQTRGPNLDPITPNDRFYVVTKNLIDPNVSRGPWRLSVKGLVDRPATYSYEQLAALPSVDQATTLECISNPVGGGLMSNALWRGVPLRTVLEAAGPGQRASRVVFHAADGYVHTTSMDKAMEATTILAYRMNGVPLPHRHGYPVRLVVPGTYGEVSVKWVDLIEVVDVAVKGYYEKQGWKAQFVQTTSRIDSPRKDQQIPSGTTVPVSGVAFAGDRGVSVVEVSTDGGQTWNQARILYAASPLTWALWTFGWRPPGPGRHELVVRATDGTRAMQTPLDHGSAPSGATGYHRVAVTVP